MKQISMTIALALATLGAAPARAQIPGLGDAARVLDRVPGLSSFLEGDPDRPLVTGRVYHGTNPVPYELPGDMTRTTLKSNSSPGGGGSNELRFEDKKDKEQIFIHAERNMDTRVKNDSMERVIVSNLDLVL